MIFKFLAPLLIALAPTSAIPQDIPDGMMPYDFYCSSPLSVKSILQTNPDHNQEVVDFFVEHGQCFQSKRTIIGAILDVAEGPFEIEVKGVVVATAIVVRVAGPGQDDKYIGLVSQLEEKRYNI